MKWEYYATTVDTAHFNPFLGSLNNLGLAGWDLVALTPVAMPTGLFFTFIFKRPRA